MKYLGIQMQEQMLFIWKYISSNAEKMLQIYITHCRKHFIKDIIQNQNKLWESPNKTISSQYFIKSFIWRWLAAYKGGSQASFLVL